MQRKHFANGAHITDVPGGKFKRCKISVHMILPNSREDATALAVLPHLLTRRSADIPSALELSRKLFELYGAELTGESYAMGASRVVTVGIAGIKSEYALEGEDLANEYLELLCSLLFNPLLENGVFAAEDVAIECEKQADYLRSEMNDKRGYCLRQARRKLYKNSPLGIESSGYLEDIPDTTPGKIYAAYVKLLECAQIEVLVCGINADSAAEYIGRQLVKLTREPKERLIAPVVPKSDEYESFAEPMATAQGKLAILCTSAHRDDAKGDITMRLANALLGGLPTSKLFMNVREKQSLCYYCASSYGFFGSVLIIDSGINHEDAAKAEQAILKELMDMQSMTVSEDELENAKRYLRSVFDTAKDSPDALMGFVFIENMKNTNRSLDETIRQLGEVTSNEVRDALARYSPAVKYLITNAKEATSAQ